MSSRRLTRSLHYQIFAVPIGGFVCNDKIISLSSGCSIQPLYWGNSLSVGAAIVPAAVEPIWPLWSLSQGQWCTPALWATLDVWTHCQWNPYANEVVFTSWLKSEIGQWELICVIIRIHDVNFDRIQVGEAQSLSS